MLPKPFAVIVAVLLVFVACGPTTTAEPTASVTDASPDPDASSMPAPSEDPSARCELTPGATADATIIAADLDYGPAVTVSAGEAVAFVNHDTSAHTVTEGVGGHAADNSCARQRIAPGKSTVVTFYRSGDYPFTCTIHGAMHTVVHVN